MAAANDPSLPDAERLIARLFGMTEIKATKISDDEEKENKS